MLEFRIAILDLYDDVPNEGMRCIKSIVQQFLISKGIIESNYSIFNIRKGQELPVLEKFDAYISTGGPGSPLIEGHDWEKNYFGFINELINYNKKNEIKKPLFAICHSFQLLFQYFEFGVINKRKSTSFGVMPIHKLEPAMHESVFFGLDEPFWAVDSRDYQAIMPDKKKIKASGAKILCIEKYRPHIPLERAIMAIRFTPEIIGTQFHPEADAEGMHRYFKTEEKRNAVIASYGELKYRNMIKHLEDPDKIMLTESVVLPNFLEHAFQGKFALINK
ncbi:GMP synthase [Lacihabitans sp. LS3-19]|uniref:type 1 glutamine amidotransferase n=1 Tax=Lacihabitans sp. LS3-19 TaxID=2487335 RepID=UPI0020CE3954|nr:GMP synthase [Lacihabitans sp. LS3-19]MCP9769800.1 GMP synthase [Lacihabitans sp. LS3-19]